MIRFNRAVAADTAFLAVLFGWILFYSYPFFFHALTDNIRQIQTYNLDAAEMLDAVKDGLARPFLRFHFDDYGHFYPNLAMLVALVYRLFTPLDDHNLFFILRTVALAGGCATILTIFVFCREFLGRIEAWFAAGLAAFTPALLTYTNEIKADSWQLFFLVLSLFNCARAFAWSQIPPSERKGSADTYLCYAALAAGAAFGTKYLGVLLLPVLVVGAAFIPVTGVSRQMLIGFDRRAIRILTASAALFLILGVLLQPSFLTTIYHSWSALGPDKLLTISRLFRFSALAVAFCCLVLLVARLGLRIDFMRHERLATWVLRGCMVAAMFGLAFVVTSPWNAAHFGFVTQFFGRVAHLGTAQRFGLEWIPFLFGYNGHLANYIDKAGGVLVAFAAIILIIDCLQRRLKARVIAFLGVLAFGMIFLAIVVVGVNRVTVLYGTPMIPVFVLLAAFALSEITRWLSRAIGSRAAYAAAGAAAMAIVAFQAANATKYLMTYPNLVTAMTSDNTDIGRWLSTCVPPEARLMSGSYTYAPPQFDAIVADGYAGLADFKPDLAVINQKMVEEARTEIDSHPPQLSTETLQRDRLYKILDNADQWRKGPTFGGLSIYMTPALASAVSTRCP